MAKEFNYKFSNQVEVIDSDKLTIVDFGQNGVVPVHCNRSVIEALSQEYEGKVNVGKLNVDEPSGVYGLWHYLHSPILLSKRR